MSSRYPFSCGLLQVFLTEIKVQHSQLSSFIGLVMNVILFIEI